MEKKIISLLNYVAILYCLSVVAINLDQTQHEYELSQPMVYEEINEGSYEFSSCEKKVPALIMEDDFLIRP